MLMNSLLSKVSKPRETINELEPTRFPDPSQEQQEVPEEEPENLDPDSGKSEGDIIDEINGQMKLF